MEEVDNATVIITDNNAYVGVVLKESADGKEIAEGSKEFEQINKSIGDQVREIHDVENVYVSVNPDFVDRINEYGEKIDQGEPVEGLFDGFNELVQRVFPDAN